MRVVEFLQAVRRSIGFAWNGLSFAFRSQRNFRFHLLAAALVLGAGFFFHLSRIEWILVLLTVSIVISAELFNTALEFALNLLESRDHPVVRHAKDIAASAVLATVLGAVIVGLLVFLH